MFHVNPLTGKKHIHELFGICGKMAD